MSNSVIKLGLLGQSIAHSLSPAIYKKILHFPFTYELIDTNECPPLEMIQKNFQGLNITAPYKKDYLPKVEIVDLQGRPAEFNAINCLFIKNSQTVYASSTDYFAACDLIEQYAIADKYLPIILGKGAMGEMIARIFQEKKILFEWRSRRDSHFNLVPPQNTPVFWVNAFERGYFCDLTWREGDIFWDLNYNHGGCNFPASALIDGTELLWLQARYAAKFWNFYLTSTHT